MQREQWFHRAVIYQVDSSLFYDANGDGYGDLAGIRQKLHYIRSLGATVLWLTPFYLTPLQDDGYDISDHLQPDPRFGTIADVIELIARARELGLRVIVELVIQHTSAQHPWFQAARRDPRSPWRPYYLWADRPPEKDDPPMFPGVEESVWRWDEQAGQYYRHMFYRHEPDLNLAHPPVIAEIENIITFWLQAGVSGFRLDAASHLVKQAGKGDEARGYPLLNHLRQVVQRLNPEAILLGEVDVAVEDYRHYFGHGDRLQMVLNFWLNKYLYLSLAQQRAAPVVKALQAMVTPPDGCCFVNWLRNHDELDLEGIGERNKRQVIRTFAPDKAMSVYQRGVRRRLAPMLDGDTRRAGDALWRRDWHGRRSELTGALRGQNADAVVGGAQRRLLPGGAGRSAGKTDSQRAVALPADQCRNGTAPPPIAAEPGAQHGAGAGGIYRAGLHCFRHPRGETCCGAGPVLSQRIAGSADAGELQPAGGRGPAPAAGRGLLEPNSGR